MPAAPREPEKYSIDEMVGRLKGPAEENPEDGELVTRSDGSQAIRVRKRKRRSTQPHKEKSSRNQRARIIQLSAALILVFLAVLAVLGAVIYANSAPFRKGLIQMIGQSSGATPELQTFRINPRTAIAGSLTLEWPAGNMLKSLSLGGLTAEVFPTSFLGKSMTGEEVTVNGATLDLQFPQAGEPVLYFKALDELPIQFNRYRTPKFNIQLAGSGNPIIGLYNSEASLSSKTLRGLPQLRLFRGNFVVNGWPKLRMDRALIEFRGNQVDVIAFRVLHESDDRGSLSFSGTVSPLQTDRPSTLTANLEAFQTSGIVGPKFGHLISGKVDSVSSATSNFLSFTPVENSSPVLDLAFSVSPTSSIELRGFPFLFALSQLLDGNEWYEKPVFDSDASGVIHRENGTVSFRNLDFQSKGLLSIKGDLAMTATEALSGNLKVGLPESMIPKTSRLKSMFGPTQEGFRWISLNISGAAAAPNDNFKELYEESRVTKDTTPTSGSPEESTFEELTRPR
jgi:hypothetical protein